MQKIEVNGNKREITTHGALQSLRSQGKVPAIIYGGEKKPSSISVDGKEFYRIMKGHGTNAIVNVKVGSKAETVLVKDLQRNVLTHEIIHIDFQRVSMSEKIEVNTPLHVVGQAPGVKLSGGILEHILRELHIKCLSKDLPEFIEVDISKLQLLESIKVKDLTLPKGVESLTDPEHLVVNIVAPSELKAETPAAETPAEGAEPEVIAKGKKPEEGEGAEDKAKAAPAKK